VSSYVGVANQAMFLLVHQASDTTGTGAATGTGTGTSSSTGTGTTKPNSAVRVRGNENRLGLIASVCFVAFVLGALLVL
jgi:hypothetical protein